MRIAIIGAGLSGLATCYYLLQLGCKVDLFDAKGVGGGASGIASGLLHPYPGEEGKRSWQADEAMQATCELLGAAQEEPKMGIVRIPRTEEERAVLRRNLVSHEDVVESEGVFLIKSGMTLNVPSYLQKLWKVCQAKGAKLHLHPIRALAELEEYDQIVVAAGASSPSFSECKMLKTQKIKGQLLLGFYPNGFPPLKNSLIGKGYIAVGDGRDLF